MTPDERAAEIVEEKRQYWQPWHTIRGIPPERVLIEEKLQAFIAQAITDAVAEEREAILAMVNERWSFNNDQQHTHSWHGKQDCLEAIRARGKP
jgi:hypothetical protein